MGTVTIEIGATALLPGGGKADGSVRCRVIGVVELFGQRYADVFVEPAGPVRRVPVATLRVSDGTSAAAETQTAVSAPRFVATVAAYQLASLLTQEGVLSAANFRVTPLPHQVLAVDFVLGKLRPRVMIADEVGLGKTIEAALVYEELKLRRRVRRALVVAPAGLTPQWQDELSQRFSEQFVIYDHPLVSALRAIHGQEANLWALNDRVITSLDFVKPLRTYSGLAERERWRREDHNRKIFEDLAEAGWDLVIFDEAHKLSKQADGSETARYRVGEALAAAAPVLLLLTATPHQGDAARFLHLLNLVDPYGFNQVSDLRPDRIGSVVWRTRKRAAVDGNGRRLFKQRITDVYPVDRSGPDHALERQLYDAVTQYVRDNYNRAMGRGDRAFGFLMILFQRLVTSSTEAIYSALVKRSERLLSLQQAFNSQPGLSQNGPEGAAAIGPDFDEEAAGDQDTQASLDDLLPVSGVVDLTELAAEVGIIGQLLDLARRARSGHDAKMQSLLNIVDEVCRREGNPRTKFLIFTEFVATQRAIRQTLEGLGYRVQVINGGQKLEERIAARQEFAGEAQFLVSTDAGGEGINLQFCHVTVNYDLPWNPMKLEQRIGRLDRIGQEHNVLVLNLLVQDTVERRVREVLEAKLNLIRQQYGDDKLADILSTLQDEFHFDRLYMDALLVREAESVQLEELAQQIYERARQVLDQDELLLPQAQEQSARAGARLVEVSQGLIRGMLQGYLAAHGETLREYRGRPDVFYFDLPDGDGVKTRYSEVVFDRELAVADDGLTYLHLNHPAIQRIRDELTAAEAPARAGLRLVHRTLMDIALPDGGGTWAVYRLHVTNYADVNRAELIPVFFDSVGRSQPRLAVALLRLAPEQVEAAYVPAAAEEKAVEARARELAEAQAADRFSELQVQHGERLADERTKVEGYYRQQEAAVAGIAIENIRMAKQRELLERRRTDLVGLERRLDLVPDVSLVALATII
jgi:superfamily II DNA or RNA helicase